MILHQGFAKISGATETLAVADSGALVAQEMGGSLTVQSDGPGQGASFTLELPVSSPELSL